MDAIIQPGLVASMMGVIADARCRRASFLAQDNKFTVMAATPDRSALFNGFLHAKVSQPGGFTIEDREFNMMRSPSMAKANVTYDGVETARLSYSGRNYMAFAAPFKGTRHPARNPFTKFDAETVIDLQKMSDAVWEDTTVEKIDFEISRGRIVIGGMDVGGAKGRASGKYDWEMVACMLHGCQHAPRMTVRMEDRGALTLLCIINVTFGALISHV